MKIPLHFLLFLFVVVAFARAEDTTAQPARVFPHPDRICYDGQCLTVNGRDLFIYSGAFHYFRCPKPLWSARFQKIKEAGFNTVETYVPWNWSERQMPAGLDDFSKVDLKDLEDWLTMAEQFGLYTIVRPGPYICAEWATGGFPEWLLTKKPEKPLRSEGWLRSDDSVYLAWSKHWLDAAFPVIAQHQITRKTPGRPGVILVQIENEYDFGPHFSDEVKINHLKALAEIARGNGIDVPLFTCWTHQVRGSSDPVLRQIFDTFNCYPRWDVDGVQKDINNLRREQPDAPLGTAELQGGWFSKVGGKLSEHQDGVTAAQINNLTLFAIQNGETVLNFYMLFGGSNLGDWGARNQTTTYDYNAPIREWGGVGDRYQRVQAIGRMLQEHGQKLARSKVVDCEVNLTQKDVTVALRRATDGSRYVFLRTGQYHDSREGTATIRAGNGDASELKFDYQLEAFGSKVLYLPPGATSAAQGEWLPKSEPVIDRPTGLASPIMLTSAKRQTDPGPSKWTTLRLDENLAQASIFDSRFVYYRTTVDSQTSTNLMIEYPVDDAVLATINGQPAARIGGGPGSSVFELPAGSATVLLLYENRGFANGRKDMEQPGGIIAARLVRPLEIKPIVGWRMMEVDGTSERPEVKPEFNDAAWKSVATESVEANFTPVAMGSGDASQLASGAIAVFRARIVVTAEELKNAKWNLKFGRIDDTGWIYMNGKSVGKTTDRSRAHSFDVTKELHPGTNLAAVVIRSNAGGVGLGAPTFGLELRGEAVHLHALGNPEGIAKEWWKPGFNDSSWKTVAISTNASQSSGMLAWYRMNFELPSTRPGIWVPWRLHLEATGNGFLYLNGHAIGRYWEAGPQHDFFLPECWLNFGEGQFNNVTLSLRATGQSGEIQKAVVEPYDDFAEKTPGLDRISKNL